MVDWEIFMCPGQYIGRDAVGFLPWELQARSIPGPNRRRCAYTQECAQEIVTA